MLSFFFHIFQPNVLIAILHILIILLHKDVVKDPEPHTKAAEKKKQRNEKFSIDFLLPPKVDMSIIAPATDLKSLMLPQSNSLPSTLLPDDFHYQPENLVRLYLQPSAMVICYGFYSLSVFTTQHF